MTHSSNFTHVAGISIAAAVLLASVDLARAIANEIHIVSPAGLEDTEGETSSNPALDSTPFRVQLLYPAADFASLPATHRLITGIAARPDASVTEPRTTTWPDMELYMMTTSADSTTASPVFTENWGPDRQLVFSRTATFSTPALGPAEGPQAFDYTIEFQRPFRYDPAQGNLLLEFFAPLGYSPPPVDDYTATSPGTWLGIALDVGATTAVNTVPQVSVLRFTFVPEPSSVALLPVFIMICMIAWGWRRLASRMRSIQ